MGQAKVGLPESKGEFFKKVIGKVLVVIKVILIMSNGFQWDKPGDRTSQKVHFSKLIRATLTVFFFVFFFLFWLCMRFEGSQFSSQGLNPDHDRERSES